VIPLGVYMSERQHIYEDLNESSSARPGGGQQLGILPSPNSKRTPNFSADIFARRGDFNACQDSIVRLYFCQTPTFCIPANILGGAYILYIRQYFGYPPIFSWDANILEGANILWICLILLLQIFVYIFSICLCIWVCTNNFGAIVLTLGLRLIL